MTGFELRPLYQLSHNHCPLKSFIRFNFCCLLSWTLEKSGLTTDLVSPFKIGDKNILKQKCFLVSKLSFCHPIIAPFVFAIAICNLIR